MPGPSTHLYIVDKVLEDYSFDSASAKYGAIATDCNMGVPGDEISRYHTHDGFENEGERISFCQELLDLASSEEERAFVFGYTSHLSADAHWYHEVYTKYSGISQTALKVGVDMLVYQKRLIPQVDFASAILRGNGDEVLFSKLEEDGITRDSVQNALLAMKGVSTLLTGIEHLFKSPGAELLEYIRDEPAEVCEEVLDFDLCKTLDIVRSDLEVLF